MKRLFALRIPWEDLATCLMGLWGGERFWFPAPLWHHLFSPVYTKSIGTLKRINRIFPPNILQYFYTKMQRNIIGEKKKKLQYWKNAQDTCPDRFQWRWQGSELSKTFPAVFPRVLPGKILCFMMYSMAKSIMFLFHCHFSRTASCTTHNYSYSQSTPLKQAIAGCSISNLCVLAYKLGKIKDK